MPLLDLTVPEGALDPDTEHQLLRTCMDLLLRHEGADPDRPAVQAMAWAYLHRPGINLVGGQAPSEPRYRVVVTVPDGILSQRRRGLLVSALTEAVLDAEPPGRSADLGRVWVLVNTVPEGAWGAGGRIVGLADIAGVALGDAEAGKRFAERRSR